MATAERGLRIRLALLAVLSLAGPPAAAAEEGVIDFERRAAVFEAAGERYCAWMALGQAGELELLQERPVEALAFYRRSLVILEAIKTSPKPLSVENLSCFGDDAVPDNLWLLLDRRPDLARPLLLRVAEAMSRKGVVGALLTSRRLSEAESELAHLADLSKPLGEAFQDEVGFLRGHLRWQQGRREEAREVLRTVLDGKRLSPEREWNVLSSLIQLAVAGGRDGEAMALYERAAAVVQRLGLPSEQSALLGLRAEILAQAGKIADADQALDQAIALARQAGDPRRQGTLERQRGELAARTEKTEKAAAHFEAAISLFQTARLPWEEARTWLLLADLYAQAGSRAAADAGLERAGELFKKSGSPVAQAETDLIAAAERLRSGETGTDEVKKKIEEVLGLPELQGTPRGQEGQELLGALEEIETIFANPRDGALAGDADGAEPGAWSELAKVLLTALPLLQRGDLAAARKILLDALAKTSSRDDDVSLSTLIGLTYAGELNLQEATSYLARAVAGIEQGAEGVQREEFLAGFLGPQQAPYSILIEVLAMQGRDVEAFDYAERARARAFLLGLGNPRIELRGGADARLVAEAEALRKQILDLERREASASMSGGDQVASELRLARQRYQSLLVRLKSTNPSYSSRTKVEPLQLRAVQAELAPDTTLISYYVSGVQVHAWVVDKETFHHVLLPLGPQDLRNAICWADFIGHRTGDRGARPLDPACEAEASRAEVLYAKLIAPLAPHIRHRKLLLVPHDVLHYLPFAALRNPATGRPLIEDYTLAYVPSASVLGVLRGKETPVTGKVLVLGAPEELDPSLKKLPAARREAEAVARLLGTRPLLGAAATEKHLRDLAGKVDLLHIAAHGVYELHNVQLSRIELSPDTEHDGRLEVHEILSDLDLSGVNLVVLSACETARGERSGGDEVTSLTRAFLSAGSPAVLSTLWMIDDTASAILMESFYRHLLKGASAAEALRQAQLSLLSSSAYQDPYYWAAFSLTGDPEGQWQPPSPGPAPATETTREVDGVAETEDSP